MSGAVDPLAALETSFAEAKAYRRKNRCTGLTATWCPVHGDCMCPETRNTYGDIDRESLDDPGCPLHSPTSLHGGASWLQDLHPFPRSVRRRLPHPGAR